MKKVEGTKGTIALVGLLLGASVATGCASTGSKQVTFRGAAAVHHAVQDVEAVEVHLDAAPARPFAFAGELSTNTISNTASIEAMRQKAAEAGLDGIYWIDCTSACSGKCTAKGFKYTHEASRNVASR